MSNTPSLTPKDIVKILKQKGFILDRSHGSHQIWLHPASSKRVCTYAQQRYSYWYALRYP